MAENIVSQINNRINLLAVFIGLIVSIIVLFAGAESFGGVVSSGNNVAIYVFTVILEMVFFGSVVTGILGSKDFYDGLINGCFLSLFILVFAGLVLGILLFIFVGIEASINSAINSYVSTSILGSFVSPPSINLTANILGNNFFAALNMVELFIVGILIVFVGAVGGSLGAFLKQIINQIL